MKGMKLCSHNSLDQEEGSMGHSSVVSPTEESLRYTSLPQVRIPRFNQKPSYVKAEEPIPSYKSKVGYGVWGKELQKMRNFKQKNQVKIFENNRYSCGNPPANYQHLQMKDMKNVPKTSKKHERVDFSQNLAKSRSGVRKPQYIGELKEGMKNGYGLWLESKDDPHSNQYRGEFMNDKKCGYGVFKWASGNYYKGNFKNDERDGYGEMYWNDGSAYKGHWHNGIQHGFGTMIFSDKTFIKGYFKNNVYLNADMIKDKSQKLSLGRPELEAQVSNLPVILPTSYKSPKDFQNSSRLEEIIEKSTISHDFNERKKSAANFNPSARSFWIGSSRMANSKRPKKSRKHKSNQIRRRTRKRNARSQSKPNKNLVVDLNLFPDRPIETEDVCVHGKQFNSTFKRKVHKIALNIHSRDS
ncbi:unnamed protein product [Moneuplotes crassus]|uniref:Uncharacterized protein n=1 Tax=Euplotes crassus TaxID=5936 RepID=A0AAD1U7T3_EUPCR|nr:unnamed protein product [Moneuplotes crassus]